MLNYVWLDWPDGFDRFHRMEGKKVDVYSFTLSPELILGRNETYNDRHD